MLQTVVAQLRHAAVAAALKTWDKADTFHSLMQESDELIARSIALHKQVAAVGGYQTKEGRQLFNKAESLGDKAHASVTKAHALWDADFPNL